jgi:hypothetical protein
MPEPLTLSEEVRHQLSVLPVDGIDRQQVARGPLHQRSQCLQLIGNLAPGLERLTEPHPEHIATRWLGNALHYVFAVGLRRRHDDIAQRHVIDEKRYAAHFEAIIGELPRKKLLKATGPVPSPVAPR